MKVKLQDLLPGEVHPISVKGDEEWLEAIYGSFPSPHGSEQPKLRAQLELLRLEQDYVQLKGEFLYQPYVACSRCALPILWPLQERLDLCFSPAVPQAYRAEHDLSPQELDEYHLVDGEIDLEWVLNEAVILALPSRTIPDCDAQHACQVCQLPVGSDCVYSSSKTKDEGTHPFAILRQLKRDD